MLAIIEILFEALRLATFQRAHGTHPRAAACPSHES